MLTDKCPDCGEDWIGYPLLDGTVKCRPCGRVWRIAAYVNDQRDRAVIARIGGNEYRRRLERRANEMRDGRYSASLAEFDRWVRQDAESLAAGKSYRRGHYSDPWAWTDTEGRPHLTPATYSDGDHVMSRRDYTTMLPEAAFDWPVYVAALTPLSEREERLRRIAAVYPAAAAEARKAWPRWECSSCRRNANQCSRETCCPDCDHDPTDVEARHHG